MRRTRLEFQDWGIIKPAWKAAFSDPFVRDPYHILMTGRAGYEYESERNAETGKRELYKSGIKMKVEGETAYEPDVLVLMERLQEMDGGSLTRMVRQATILKDRSTVIDGKTFENPTYADFAPVIEVMLDAPATVETAAERDAGTLVQTEEEQYARKQRRKVLLEEIEGYLTSVWPSQTAEQKKRKADALSWAFGTRSWTAIEMMSPEQPDSKPSRALSRWPWRPSPPRGRRRPRRRRRTRNRNGRRGRYTPPSPVRPPLVPAPVLGASHANPVRGKSRAAKAGQRR